MKTVIVQNKVPSFPKLLGMAIVRQADVEDQKKITPEKKLNAH